RRLVLVEAVVGAQRDERLAQPMVSPAMQGDGAATSRRGGGLRAQLLGQGVQMRGVHVPTVRRLGPNGSAQDASGQSTERPRVPGRAPRRLPCRDLLGGELAVEGHLLLRRMTPVADELVLPVAPLRGPLQVAAVVDVVVLLREEALVALLRRLDDVDRDRVLAHEEGGVELT